MDLSEMQSLIDAAPVTAAEDEIDAAARGWLAEVGLPVERQEGSPCSLVAVMVDEDGEIAVYAVPDAQLEGSARAEIAAVSGSGFEWHFSGDLAPEQFAGAFRICGGISTEHDVFEDQVVELREEMDDEAPDMDWDALLAGAGAWNEFRVSSGSQLGPVTHIYTVRLSM